MFRRLIALVLSLLLVVPVLASCGSEPIPGAESSEPAVSSAEPAESGEETPAESETEAPATEEPATSKYEYEYVAPEDGSFTVCGVPLSEYSIVLSFPGLLEYSYMEYREYKSFLPALTLSATGIEPDIKVVKSDKHFAEKEFEHEILFGVGFIRDGMPEPDTSKSCYGVTADGTIYFSTPSISLYPYLYQLFLEEFLGVPFESGERSAGCALTECYREIPNLDLAKLEADGYKLVFEDDFDADELDPDVWEARGNGPQGAGYCAPSQISVRDGNLVITAQYRTEGDYGEGWYSAEVALKKRYCRGYLEATIKCSKNAGRGDAFWSAFWLQGPNPYNAEASQGGVGPGGCEIDIMENFGPDHYTSCMHCAVEEGTEIPVGPLSVVCNLGKNYEEEYHTFALLWDEEFYRCYVDGQLLVCNHHLYGTSAVEEQVNFSLVPYKNINLDHSETREILVDSLRIWQK